MLNLSSRTKQVNLLRIRTINSYNLPQCFCRQLSTAVKCSNHYKTLGISENATHKQIKSAYINQCQLYHPDKHPGNAVMHEKFVSINNAYEVLSTTSKRQQYDETFKYAQEQSRQTRNPYHNHNPRWSDYPQKNREKDFEDFFRDGGASRRTSHHHNSDPLNEYWNNVYRGGEPSSRPRPRSIHLSRNNDYVTIGVIIFLCMLVVAARIQSARDYQIKMRRLSEMKKKIAERNEDVEG